MRRIAGEPVEIAERLRREVRERVGLPITVGVARTKFLAKVASAVAKPDGLLARPAGPGARVPPPAAGRAALGRRRGDGREAPWLRHPHGRRAGRRPRGARSRRCSAARRAATCTRSPTTATRVPSIPDAVDARSARSARSAARRSHRPRSSSRDRPRRARHPPDENRGARRPHGRAAAALRRLLPRDPLAHAPAPDRAHRHDPRDDARAARTRRCR